MSFHRIATTWTQIFRCGILRQYAQGRSTVIQKRSTCERQVSTFPSFLSVQQFGLCSSKWLGQEER